MLEVELVKQLLRVRTLVALVGSAAVPVFAGLLTASKAGGRNGTQTGLYGAAPYSALNHVAAALQFTSPLLLAVAVALLGSAIGSSDREWGTLRYLYLLPVGRLRLLGGKWMALVVCSGLAVACVLLSGLIVGLVAFGWHPFHRLDASSLTTISAAGRLLEAAGYVTVCVLSVGTLAFALALLLPAGAEALGAGIVFVVAGNIVDGQPSLRALAAALPVHYWGRWTHLLQGGPAGLLAGLAVQAIWITAALLVAGALLRRRDPIA